MAEEGAGADGNPAAPPRRMSRRQLRRLDSLEVAAGKVTGLEHGRKVLTRAVILRLAFQTIGVVYGDVGTSPLYVYSSTFTKGIDPAHVRTNILGALSLIIYTLTLSPLIKYVFIVLQANDHGEGGAFALYSLICRNVNVGLVHKQPEDRNLSAYKLDLPKKRSAVGLWIKSRFEGSKVLQYLLLFLTFFGTCMVIGDGTLTPSISVLSAVQGIQVQVPSLRQGYIVVISMIILVGLFSVQRFGTDKVGFMFAPVLTVWFLMIGLIGLYNIVHHNPAVFQAFNPKHIVDYFRLNKKEGFISLGGIVLCITGTEAMFADLGHFCVPSIQLAFSTYVYPALLLAYMGQAAYLMEHPEHVGDAFYKAVPKSIYWPMFVVAVLAAIIASQAMISAVFQILKQAEALGCFPRIKIVHTSKKFHGQVYIPEMNWFLMFACLLITVIFQKTTTIGNAYGICVTMDMAITTTFTTLVMLMIWQVHIALAVLYVGVYYSVELTYFASVMYKFKDGGWLPFLFAVLFLTVISTWYYGTGRRYRYELDNKMSSEWVAGLGADLGVSRVRGAGLVYTPLPVGLPAIFAHSIANLPAMHSLIVFVTIKSLPVSNVLPAERFLFRRVGPRDFHMYRAVARYGYQDAHKGDAGFEDGLFNALADFICFHDAVPELRAQQERRAEEEVGGEAISVAVYPAAAAAPPAGEAAEVGAADASLEEEADKEVAFVEECRKAGVVYLLGDTDVVARTDSSVVNKLLINYLYAFLRKNFRQSTLILNIPHTRLLKVGMVSYV